MYQNEHFQIVYDGPALATHEMPVRDLTPALMALADLLEQSSSVLNGNQVKVQVNVKGTFKTGCFQIDFTALSSIATDVFNFISSDKIEGARTLIALLGLGGVLSKAEKKFNLISLIKYIGKRHIKKVIPINGSATKSLVILDDEQLEVENRVIKLYKDFATRTKLEEIVKPLEREGIDSVGFKSPSDSTFIMITKEERDLFEAPKLDEELINSVISRRVIVIDNIPIRQTANKWKFSDGDKPFFANIVDADFIQKVNERNVLFGTNDFIEVDLEMRQFKTKSGELRNEYTVLKVIKTIPGGVQIKLDYEKGDNSGS
jgi:hypothetical protein